MKNNFVFLFTIFCIFQCELVHPYTEQEARYLANLERALDAFQFPKLLDESDLRADAQKLLLHIYELEKAHPDFVQCVTSQDSFFYSYQVIAKALHQKLYGCSLREDFQPLRFPIEPLLKNKEDFFSHYPSLIISRDELIKEFKTTSDDLIAAIKAHEAKSEEAFRRIARGEPEEKEDSDGENDDEEDGTPARYRINDSIPEISKELISVNFTMETCLPMDSAMFVFMSGQSVSLATASDNAEEYEQKFSKILEQLFSSLSLPQDKLAACLDQLVKKAPHSDLGIVNQIFLPKKNASDFLYVSFGGGFLHSLYDDNFEESLEEFQSNRQEPSFRTFRNFQARILAGMLSEDSEVKFFRHTLIPEAQQKQYEALVQEILNELLP